MLPQERLNGDRLCPLADEPRDDAFRQRTLFRDIARRRHEDSENGLRHDASPKSGVYSDSAFRDVHAGRPVAFEPRLAEELAARALVRKFDDNFDFLFFGDPQIGSSGNVPKRPGGLGGHPEGRSRRESGSRAAGLLNHRGSTPLVTALRARDPIVEASPSR